MSGPKIGALDTWYTTKLIEDFYREHPTKYLYNPWPYSYPVLDTNYLFTPPKAPQPKQEPKMNTVENKTQAVKTIRGGYDIYELTEPCSGRLELKQRQEASYGETVLRMSLDSARALFLLLADKLTEKAVGK